MTKDESDHLAATLLKAYPEEHMGKYHDVEIDTWYMIVKKVAMALKTADPTFDRRAFIVAATSHKENAA